jgi:hypothetical protein
VFLLMAPFLDMINHATKNNCMFGIDPSSTRWVSDLSAHICTLGQSPCL